MAEDKISEIDDLESLSDEVDTPVKETWKRPREPNWKIANSPPTKRATPPRSYEDDVIFGTVEKPICLPPVMEPDSLFKGQPSLILGENLSPLDDIKFLNTKFKSDMESTVLVPVEDLLTPNPIQLLDDQINTSENKIVFSKKNLPTSDPIQILDMELDGTKESKELFFVADLPIPDRIKMTDTKLNSTKECNELFVVEDLPIPDQIKTLDTKLKNTPESEVMFQVEDLPIPESIKMLDARLNIHGSNSELDSVTKIPPVQTRSFNSAPDVRTMFQSLPDQGNLPKLSEVSPAAQYLIQDNDKIVNTADKDFSVKPKNVYNISSHKILDDPAILEAGSSIMKQFEFSDFEDFSNIPTEANIVLNRQILNSSFVPVKPENRFEDDFVPVIDIDKKESSPSFPWREQQRKMESFVNNKQDSMEAQNGDMSESVELSISDLGELSSEMFQREPDLPVGPSCFIDDKEDEEDGFGRQLESQYCDDAEYQLSQGGSSYSSISSFQDDVLPGISKKKKRKKRSKKTREEVTDDGDIIERTVRPNYFVGVQITNPMIHEAIVEVQEGLLASCPELSRALIDVATLHITLLVAHIPDEDTLYKACSALDKCGATLETTLMEQPLNLNFSSLSHFGHQTLFVKLVEDDNCRRFMEVVTEIRKMFAENNICNDVEKELVPHLTIAKLSRMPRVKGQTKIRRIDSSVFDMYLNMEFGSQCVTSIQLLSMDRAKDDKRYYSSAREYVFDAADSDDSEDHSQCCFPRRPEITKIPSVFTRSFSTDATESVEISESPRCAIATECTEIFDLIDDNILKNNTNEKSSPPQLGKKGEENNLVSVPTVDNHESLSTIVDSQTSQDIPLLLEPSMIEATVEKISFELDLTSSSVVPPNLTTPLVSEAPLATQSEDTHSVNEEASNSMGSYSTWVLPIAAAITLIALVAIGTRVARRV